MSVRKSIPKHYQWKNLFPIRRSNELVSEDTLVMVLDGFLWYKGKEIGQARNENEYKLLLEQVLNED